MRLVPFLAKLSASLSAAAILQGRQEQCDPIGDGGACVLAVRNRAQDVALSDCQSFMTRSLVFNPVYVTAPASRVYVTTTYQFECGPSLARDAKYARQAPVTVITGSIPVYARASGACGSAEYSSVCRNCLAATVYPPSGVFQDFVSVTGITITKRGGTTTITEKDIGPCTGGPATLTETSTIGFASSPSSGGPSSTSLSSLVTSSSSSSDTPSASLQVSTSSTTTWSNSTQVPPFTSSFSTSPTTTTNTSFSSTTQTSLTSQLPISTSLSNTTITTCSTDSTTSTASSSGLYSNSTSTSPSSGPSNSSVTASTSFNSSTSSIWTSSSSTSPSNSTSLPSSSGFSNATSTITSGTTSTRSTTGASASATCGVASQILCNGNCTNVLTDVNNCGRCGTRCEDQVQNPGATRAYCDNGVCTREPCDGQCNTTVSCGVSDSHVNCGCAQTSEGRGLCFNKVAAGLCEAEQIYPKCSSSGDCPPLTVCVPAACCKENSTQQDDVGRCVNRAGCEATARSRLGAVLLFERVGDGMVEVGGRGR